MTDGLVLLGLGDNDSIIHLGGGGDFRDIARLSRMMLPCFINSSPNLSQYGVCHVSVCQSVRE